MHQFFQQFNINNSNQTLVDPIYNHNCMVLEISNNWSFVRWLIYRHTNNLIKQVDQIENDWLQFIFKNQINIEFYEKDVDRFLTDNLKKPL